MDFTQMLTDELTDIREVEHRNRNYPISDAIRDELDSRGSFCMDTPNGQVVYHMGEAWANNRIEFILKIKEIDRSFNRK